MIANTIMQNNLNSTLIYRKFIPEKFEDTVQVTVFIYS